MGIRFSPYLLPLFEVFFVGFSCHIVTSRLKEPAKPLTTQKQENFTHNTHCIRMCHNTIH